MLPLLLMSMFVHTVLSQCSTCKEVTGDGPLAGIYLLTTNLDDRCRNSCVYEKESTQELYCFEIRESPSYSTENCTKLESSRMIIEEDGVIIEQKQSFNPDTGDLSIEVEQHGTRAPIKVIINTNSSTMTEVSGNVCQIKSVPASVEPKAVTGNRTTDDQDTITPEMETTEYRLTLPVGEASEEEIEMMAESGKGACEGRKIVKTEERMLNKDDFETLSSGGLVQIGSTETRYKRETADNKRQTADNCTLESMCASRGTGCWRWPFGTQFSIHFLNADVVCVDCCSSGSSDEYCSCSEIVNAEILGQCLSVENETCPDGFYLCDGECLVESKYGIMKKCGEGCPEGTVSCGNSCIPSIYQANYKDCNGECQGVYQPCNGTCLDGYTVCGDRCVQDYWFGRNYKVCNDQCITKSTPCNGTCEADSFLCGGTCRLTSSSAMWRDCNGSCLHRSQACGVECMEGSILCGNSSQCILEEGERYYRECNGNCISSWEQCEDTCPSGYISCGDQCIQENYRDLYYACGDSCLYISNQCNGTCPNNTFACNNYCVRDSERDLYYTCGDQCLNYAQQCNGTCPLESQTTCGYRCLSTHRRDPFYPCGDQCNYYTQQCNGTCPFQSQVPCGAYSCQDDSGEYQECDGSCQEKNRACNGECAEGYVPCGNISMTYRCLKEEGEGNWYRSCGEECLYQDQPCNGTCMEGYYLCAGRCIDENTACGGNEPECAPGWTLCENSPSSWQDYCYSNNSNSVFYPCGDTCIPKHEYCEEQSTCFQDYQVCGYLNTTYYTSQRPGSSTNELCYNPGATTLGNLIYPCNGTCLINEPCESECPTGWTVCQDGSSYLQGNPYIDVCYNDSEESPFYMHNGFCWKKPNRDLPMINEYYNYY